MKVTAGIGTGPSDLSPGLHKNMTDLRRYYRELSLGMQNQDLLKASISFQNKSKFPGFPFSRQSGFFIANSIKHPTMTFNTNLGSSDSPVAS